MRGIQAKAAGGLVAPAPPPPDGGKKLSVKQIASRWCVSRSIVYALVASGVIPHVRVGLGRGTIRVAVADMEEYERSHRRDDTKLFAEHLS